MAIALRRRGDSVLSVSRFGGIAHFQGMTKLASPGSIAALLLSFGAACSSSDALLRSLDGGPGNQAGSGAPAAAGGVGGGAAPDAAVMDLAISGGGGTDTAVGGASPSGGMKGNGAAGAAGGGGRGGASGGGGPGTPVLLPPLSFLQLFDFDSDLDYQTSRFASVALADVDGDGILDVVAGQVPQAIDSSPVVMRGNGDGTFGAPVAIDSIVATSVLLVGDLNGDGSPDLAFDVSSPAGSLSPGVTFALNNGDGTFGSPIAAQVGHPTRGFDPTLAYFGDLDGDGLADFAALQSSGISVSLGAGDGTFGPAISYSHGAGVPAPLPQHNTRPLGRFLATGDLNGDGNPDFVVSLESGYLSFVLNQGDGTFGAPTFLGTAGLPDAIALTDLDADGDLDAIVGEESLGGSGTVTLDVFSNEGGAPFAPPAEYPATVSTDVRQVDLNGDALPDVCTAGSNIYLNDGHGKLAAAITLPVTIGGPIAFGDVNGDGKTDVVIGAFRHVHVLLNTSP